MCQWQFEVLVGVAFCICNYFLASNNWVQWLCTQSQSQAWYRATMSICIKDGLQLFQPTGPRLGSVYTLSQRQKIYWYIYMILLNVEVSHCNPICFLWNEKSFWVSGLHLTCVSKTTKITARSGPVELVQLLTQRISIRLMLMNATGTEYICENVKQSL